MTLKRLSAPSEPLVLGRLVLAPKTLPGLNRMQPFTDIQLAQAVSLARLLAAYNEGRIPEGRFGAPIGCGGNVTGAPLRWYLYPGKNDPASGRFGMHQRLLPETS